MVALAISALVLLGARAVFGQLADGAERVAETARESDAEANALRLLRDVVGRIEIQPEVPGEEEERAFVGTAQGVRFWSWCDVPAGWQERCHLTLGIIPLDRDTALVLGDENGRVLPLRRSLHSARMMYLRDAGSGGQWLHGWRSSVITPLAIGIVTRTDTLMLRIGERG